MPTVFERVTQQVANGVGDLKINGSTVKGAAFTNNARNIDAIMRNQVEAPLAKFYLKNSKISKISIKVVDNKLVLS